MSILTNCIQKTIYKIIQWCSKTTKLLDQDHQFFQDHDQDRSGQDQDHFFKTKTVFLKTVKLLT